MAALGAIMDGQEVLWGDLGAVLAGLEAVLGRSWMILRRYLCEGGCGTRAQAVAEKESYSFMVHNTRPVAAQGAADLNGLRPHAAGP